MKANTPVLILSDDGDLSDRLSRYLLDTYNQTVLSCHDPETATAEFRRIGGPTTFVDLRLPWLSRVVRSIHEAQSDLSSHAARLVPICGGYYPADVAAMLDRFSVAHMRDPLDGRAAETALDQLNGGRNGHGNGHLPPPMVVSAGDVSITVYTPALYPLIERLQRVAVHDVTILLVGETGTGKTTLAQLIHQLSDRREQPFHSVACGALPDDLIESELFGHVRGAFTGAERSKIGRFEAAGRGTLLLDEIDVLGPKEQANLLRVIETGEYELVGSTETRCSQARLIVASNVDLESLARDKQFRTDLYYRLNVLEFRLPPLRERRLDIVPLAMQFVDECCRQHGLSIERVHVDFLSAIKSYNWPGNIRELKNHIQRAVLFCENAELTLDDLSPNIRNGNPGTNGNGDAAHDSWSLADRVARSERDIIEEVLRANDYKRAATAQALGISRVGLYKKMKRFGMLNSN